MKRGFTLIEILIVVIILGILAAIVIPQFTSASEDAKQSAVASTVQSVRSQIELYKLNHGDTNPTLWADLVNQTTYGTTTYGPYMQAVPVNPFVAGSGGTVVANALSSTTAGWAFIGTNGGSRFYGVGKGGSWVGQ